MEPSETGECLEWRWDGLYTMRMEIPEHYKRAHYITQILNEIYAVLLALACHPSNRGIECERTSVLSYNHRAQFLLAHRSIEQANVEQANRKNRRISLHVPMCLFNPTNFKFETHTTNIKRMPKKTSANRARVEPNARGNRRNEREKKWNKHVEKTVPNEIEIFTQRYGRCCRLSAFQIKLQTHCF